MLQKLLHKKGMFICLLIGNLLLSAVAVSYPMYRVSSFQRMLIREFETYRQTKDTWPADFSVTYGTIKGSAGAGFERISEEAGQAAESLGLPFVEQVVEYELSSQKAEAVRPRDGENEKRLTVAALSGLEDHVEIISGRFPAADSGEPGVLEVMVSAKAQLQEDLLPGDEYLFSRVMLDGEAPCTIRIVGTFSPVDEKDLYWEDRLDDVKSSLYMSEQTFADTFLGEEKESRYSLNGRWDYYLDYTKTDVTEVGGLMKQLRQLEKNETLKGHIKEGALQGILEDYSAKANRIEATLFILQVPVLLLLCAFLYMISGQMLSMEQNEIALMRSRGASKAQIFFLYLMQSGFVGACSGVFGIPLGILCCKLLGSATAFLQFSVKDSLSIRITPDVFLYFAGAFLVSVLMTTIPVLPVTLLSIVKVKQGNSREKKSLWKRLYLDVICLGVSMYGYYSFHRTSDKMMEDVLSGKALDPLLYISFSLFLLGAGLFMARIQPLLLKAFFRLGKNKMQPSTYASLLGTIRTGKKQEFIILFLILTVAIGLSNTVIARSIVGNAVQNEKYMLGAEFTLEEKWSSNKAARLRDPSLKLAYQEPDFSKYETIPGVVAATAVLLDENSSITDASEKLSATLMGIRPNGFYQVADLQSARENGLLPFHYSEYLQVLGAQPGGILVSENFLTRKGYKLGDQLSFQNSDGDKISAKICGFFSYWPTYQPVQYSLGEDGSVLTQDTYLIVANLNFLKERWGARPYQVWLQTEDEGKGLYQWIEEQKDYTLTELTDRNETENGIIHDTMVQGTNGILSMSFMVVLLLCCVGYLIYWILSIRSRELLFGVLRAMGMRRKEITWMLTVEQICSGLYGILAGGGIGFLSSYLFVPMIQQAYAASTQILPLQMMFRAGDLLRLFIIIGLMLCVCLLVLGRLVSRMNISSALKLGED